MDYILTMQDGTIAERGTYDDLMRNNGPFAKFVSRFGGKDEELSKKRVVDNEEDIEELSPAGGRKTSKPKANNTKGAALMQTEERAIGAVDGSVYHGYLK